MGMHLYKVSLISVIGKDYSTIYFSDFKDEDTFYKIVRESTKEAGKRLMRKKARDILYTKEFDEEMNKRGFIRLEHTFEIHIGVDYEF
jgi:hypothetical protein